jgi:N6-L-threonylcarbamoyladenine synthase
MANQPVYILSIESSCDDTAAAVLLNDKVLSNVVARQEIHEQYGGVVPELASRAHQQNIVPVVDVALAKAGLNKSQLSGQLICKIACTRAKYPISGSKSHAGSHTGAFYR